MNLTHLGDLPNWSDYARVGLDIETRDPDLTKTGPGVRRGIGYITGVSFACEGGPAAYLPMRHEGGGNYSNPDQILEYLRHQGRHFRGEIVGANLQYDLDWLAEDGVIFTPSFFRDIQVSGPLLDQPEMAKKFNPANGSWFWGDEFHSMSLDAQAKRLGLPGKDETKLNQWAEEHGLNPKSDMWKAPAHIVAEYAIQDAELPLGILALHEKEIEAQGLQPVFDMESRLLPVLLKMRRRGVAVDLSKLERIEKRSWALEQTALEKLRKLTGVSLTTEDTNKSAAMAMALEADGVKVPKTETKISKRTGNETGGGPSVTSPWLRELGTPVAEAILSAKKWNKVRTTFCQSIRTHEIKGRIHCTFNQLRQEREDGSMRGAAFGRLSSSQPNLQQQPARDPEIGPLWRSLYLPDEGGQWACLDFSSQEPRMITHYAELTGCTMGKEAAEACRTDPKWDNHQMTADMCGIERKEAKTIFLALVYGMGGGKLCRSLGLPTVWETPSWANGRSVEIAGPEGAALIAKFNDMVPYVKELQRMVRNKAEKVDFITTLLGRRCRFPRNPQTGKLEWLHKGLNRLIQGSAADQTKMAMVLADEAGIRIQLAVHDEIDLTIWDIKEAEQLNEIMVSALPLNVPTRCDLETGPSWGEIEAVK